MVVASMVQEFETFYEKRFRKQRQWYHQHAERNRRLFIGLRVSVVVLALAVPGTVSYSGLANVLTLPAVYGIAILLVMGETLLAVLNPEENWLNYRTTWQALTREEQFFSTRTGPYAAEGGRDPEELFVERVEYLIGQENRVWRLVAQQEESVP